MLRVPCVKILTGVPTQCPAPYKDVVGKCVRHCFLQANTDFEITSYCWLVWPHFCVPFCCDDVYFPALIYFKYYKFGAPEITFLLFGVVLIFCPYDFTFFKPRKGGRECWGHVLGGGESYMGQTILSQTF